MADPSNFVNWSDYLGVNQEAADAMTKRLMDPLNQQAGQLGTQQANFIGDAEQNGQTHGGYAYGSSGGEQNYHNSLMSYGDAVERMRDPAARASVMQKQFGSGSAIDSAMVGANGGQLQQLEQSKQGVFRGDENMQTEVTNRFAQGRSERAQWDAADTAYQARKQAAYDQNQKDAAAKAQDAKNKPIDMYAKNIDPNYDPNGTSQVEGSNFWDGNWEGKNTTTINQRDQYAGYMAKDQAAHPGKTYKYNSEDNQWGWY